ncbi:GNAT family N-acetyltransferase [Lacticaseibacillus casei]|uniref:GNAT family N-acetyltransferase n=1 Tax=Lacticaseibacillus casei TaxID=1582 RepID=UPI0014868826|nr:N-acetyltransferase [Lacticaseibacillus casei]
MTIRRIQQNDFAEVDALLQTAFSGSKRGYHGEAALFAELRRTVDYDAALEVVATIDGHLVGYGLMTAVTITPDAHMQGVALAPLAVAPDYQGSGLGMAIVSELDMRATDLRRDFVSVIGDRQFFGRIGFRKAANYRLEPPFPIVAEDHPIKELVPGVLASVRGKVNYAHPFLAETLE